MKLFLILMIFFCACSINEKGKEEDSVKYFSGMNFPNFEEPNTGLGRAVNFQDTLKVEVGFSECGIWGGRQEKILLFRDENMGIQANFTVDTVCCKSIVTNNKYGELDDKSRVIKLNVTKTLSQEDERLINLFIHRVVELSLNDEFYNFWYKEETNEIEEIDIVEFIDTGAYVKIFNSSSNFYIYFHNPLLSANTWYGRVRKQVFGDLINLK